ncbi:MAG: preprotein translocase subunit SecE [Candidatus Wallbacteria bacterium]|nr:preprotein translocase subunit SecE [Candidatus Wallbacteria bacterium]
MKKYWLIVVEFLKEVRGELKKVSWPSREGVFTSTKVVLLLSLMLGAYVGVVDALFRFIINQLLSMR